MSYLIVVLLSPSTTGTARADDSSLRDLLAANGIGSSHSAPSFGELLAAPSDDAYRTAAFVQAESLELTAWSHDDVVPLRTAFEEERLPDQEWSTLPPDDLTHWDADVEATETGFGEGSLEMNRASDDWTWRVLPAGLIYRSYMAGVHEPRIAIVAFYEQEAGQTLWDATLGGRGGVLRFGNGDPFRPQGWQLDVEGAVMVRLDVENRQDLESSDYRFGFPITYGIANWQFKFGYYHISSHLGDERMLREPGQDERVNYVRDGILYGVSYYPVPAIRIYGEIGGAFNSDGGAEPFETQFGTELSPPGPTGGRGAPFLAINGHLRQDHHFGGDVTVQTGWLWRGEFGQMMRLGAHYFNGKSSQFQFFNAYEEQIGVGLWYDF